MDLLTLLTRSEAQGLLKLAKELDEEMLADPGEYGYGRGDFDGTDQEYDGMIKGHRIYGRLADMNSYTLYRHPDGRVSVKAIMTMSHVDRYHYENGTWRFEGP
jgi:hypothetical protein